MLKTVPVILHRIQNNRPAAPYAAGVATVMLMLSLCGTQVLAKGVPLDSIYISRRAPAYTRLLHTRLDSYAAVSASYADNSVICAEWVDGNQLVYIKELDSYINHVYLFNIHSRKTKKIYSFKGTLITSGIAMSTRSLVIKYFDTQHPPRVKTILLDCIKGKVTQLPLNRPAVDFTIAPGGSSVLFNSPGGIYSLDTSTRTHHLKVPSKRYAGYRLGSSHVLLYPAPEGNNSLFIGGEGGSYKGTITGLLKKNTLTDITSATEIFWTSSNTFIYRNGGPGSYNVRMYNISSRHSSYLVKGSMDTCLTYQHSARTAAFCHNQMLYIHDTRSDETSFTGIETDEPRISPTGQYISSLLHGRLFIINRNILLKKQVILGRYWKKFLFHYRSVKKQRQWHKNEYSSKYITRRQNAYRKLLSD